MNIRGENCLKCREILLNVDHMDSEAVIVNVLDFVYYMYLYLAPTPIAQVVFNSNP